MTGHHETGGPRFEPAPFIPPLATGHLPAVGGQMGDRAEHFQVEEVPAYEPCGEGEHLYVWVEKKGHNTRDVVRYLARAANVKERDIGFAGMKDRQAVTRQWFSLPARSAPATEWALPDGVSVQRVSAHKNKLRTGHLIGNRFVITLINVPDGGLARAEPLAQAITTDGVPNYFGPQRFGRDGRNLSDAFAWLKDGHRPPRGTDEKLLSSVLQSEHFNRYASARLQRRAELLLGDVVRLNGSGKHFTVESPDVELPRLLAGDLHLTGAMLGQKSLQTHSAARELELEVASAMGLTPELQDALARHAPGARRDLLLWPEALTLRAQDAAELELTFALPAGAYATQLVREFTRSPWAAPRSPGDG